LWNESLASYLKSRSTQILLIDTFRVIEFNSENPDAPLNILKERMTTLELGFHRDIYPFLEPIYKLIVERLTENGVLMHLIEEWRNPDKLYPKPAEKQPEVLTLEQLAIGFKLFGISVGVAAIFFIAEMFKACIRRLKMKWSARVQYF